MAILRNRIYGAPTDATLNSLWAVYLNWNEFSSIIDFNLSSDLACPASNPGFASEAEIKTALERILEQLPRSKQFVRSQIAASIAFIEARRGIYLCREYTNSNEREAHFDTAKYSQVQRV